MYGFYELCGMVPKLRVGDVRGNARELAAAAAGGAGAAVILFPELALTGAGCGSLFLTAELHSAVESAVRELLAQLPPEPLIFFGLPLAADDRVYNALAAVQGNRLLGLVPAQAPDRRIFASGAGVSGRTLDYAGCREVPFGTDLLFQAGEILAGAVIGADRELPLDPGTLAAAAGAGLLLCPDARPDRAGERELAEASLTHFSRERRAVCLAVFSGTSESTTSGVNSGGSFLVEAGEMLAASPRFRRENVICRQAADFGRIAGLRRRQFRPECVLNYRRASGIAVPAPPEVIAGRTFPAEPFLPADAVKRREVAGEILSLQCAGLAKRLEHIHASGCVLGISGGLDSTLALLVCTAACRLLGRPAAEITAVTMPGFGTTGRTYRNAVGLCRALGVKLLEIPIEAACLQHFRDIGHDPADRDVVYENSQARERTQIILDLANQTGALAVGTGDLSEAALGWCTFNGDHIAMYSVNCGVPKTVIPEVLLAAAPAEPAAALPFIEDVIATPVSPELLPAAENGEIKQKTEDIVGPYRVHDFLIWHFLTYGAPPEKLRFLLELVFGGEYPAADLDRWLAVFRRRFLSQQFKRNCSPDGPQVLAAGLSPHGALLLPSDAVWSD